MADPGLISVRTEVVLDTLVGSIAERVAARFDEPLLPEVEAALGAAGDGWRRRLARAGYLARGAEVARFERARRPMPWLAERLAAERGDWGEASGALAAGLAATEPGERPDPGDERAASWKIPGPGGHVRHYLAVRAAEELGAPAGPEAKRAWLAGFLVHCIEEAEPPEA